jgi:hypothetical protein
MASQRVAQRLARLLIQAQHVRSGDVTATSGLSAFLQLAKGPGHSLLPVQPSQPLIPSFVSAHSFSTSFHEKKRRALERQQQQEQQLVPTSGAQPTAVDSLPPPAVAPGTTALTTIVPSETQASPEQVEQVVGHTALVITRPIEWGTVILGYEQANR